MNQKLIKSYELFNSTDFPIVFFFTNRPNLLVFIVLRSSAANWNQSARNKELKRLESTKRGLTKTTESIFYCMFLSDTEWTWWAWQIYCAWFIYPKDPLQRTECSGNRTKETKIHWALTMTSEIRPDLNFSRFFCSDNAHGKIPV